MSLTKFSLTALTFAIAMSSCLQAQTPMPVRYALTSKQVSQALEQLFAERGIQPSQAKVRLPATVLLSEQEPALDVGPIEALGITAGNSNGEVSSAVKLSCHQHGVCLPFYAIVTLPEGNSLVPIRNERAVSNGTQIATRKAKLVMKAGTPATLIMDDSKAHIQISVVSMQSGSIGQKIRVSSLDHKQMYFAEVLSANTVKGSF